MQPVHWRGPEEARRGALLPAFTPAYLEHIQQPGLRRPQRLARGPLALAGLMAPVEAGFEASRLWGSLGQALARRWDACPPQGAAPGFFGVTACPGAAGTTGFYLAARSLGPQEKAAPPLVLQTLPAGEYLCLEHAAPPETLPLTLTFLYCTWLPKAGLQPALPLEILAFGPTPPWEQAPERAALWLPVQPCLG